MKKLGGMNMNASWKQTGKGTWSAGEHERGIEGHPVWTATIRQRKNAKESVYSWTVGGHRKGTFSGIGASLAAAKEAALVAVETHIVPAAEDEPRAEAEAAG
jgi:hypothetical protein